MAGVAYKQDLPPKGGYAPINFKRIPAKQVKIKINALKKRYYFGMFLMFFAAFIGGKTCIIHYISFRF